MATKIVLDDLASLQNESSATNTINRNMDRIETAIDNTLSRIGTTPNAMQANLDMNSHRILNLPEPVDDTEPIRLGDVDVVQLEADVAAAAASATAAASSASSASTSASSASTSASSASSSATSAANSAAVAQAATANPAVRYTFSSSTADSDPGNGIFKLNNATPGSATTIYLDNLDADGNTVTTWIDAMDDSTATIKGQLVVRDVTAPTGFYVYSVTGSVVDGTGYRKVTISNIVNGGGTLAGDSVIWFTRSGDAGSVDFNAVAADTIAPADLLLFGDASDSNNSNTSTVSNFFINTRGARVHTGAGAVTVAATDYAVVVNKASGAATTVNLPASPATGQTHLVKDGKGDANTNNITLTPAAGNIDGAATQIMSVPYQSVDLIYNGTEWNIL